MPYSMDPEANKENPYSPSQQMGMEAQLIYKIASLESTMSNSLRRLDEKFDRLLSEIHDRHVETTQYVMKMETELKGRLDMKRLKIENLEKEVAKRAQEVEQEAERKIDEKHKEIEKKNEALIKDIEELKHWRTVVVARMSMIGVGAFAIWAIIGQPIQNLVGSLIGAGP